MPDGTGAEDAVGWVTARPNWRELSRAKYRGSAKLVPIALIGVLVQAMLYFGRDMLNPFRPMGPLSTIGLAFLIFVMVFAEPHDRAAKIAKSGQRLLITPAGVQIAMPDVTTSIGWQVLTDALTTKTTIELRFPSGTVILPLRDLAPGDAERVGAWAAAGRQNRV